MVGTLIGFKSVNFEDDKGNAVSGTRIYVEYEDSQISGMGCDSKYFPSDTQVKLPPNFEINHKYEFVFEQHGFSGKPALVAVKALN